MKKIIASILIIAVANLGYAQVENQSIVKNDIIIGHSISLDSKVIYESRKLNIYLPDGYNNNTDKEYPVIYLLDGSLDKDFIPTVGLVKLLATKGYEKSIVVGIESSNRTSDFTFPTKVANELSGFPPSGNSKKFIEFISDELLDFVEESYNVSKKRTIIGNTFGGLLVSEILLTQSHLFDNYIIISPSLWWNNKSILEYETNKITSNKKMYLAAWIQDPEGKKLYDSFIQKIKKESKKASNKKVQYSFQFLEENEHGSISHLATYKGLKMVNQN